MKSPATIAPFVALTVLLVATPDHLLFTATSQGVAQAAETVPAPLHAVPPSEPYTWHNVSIVGGGFVSGVVFHPRFPGIAYARTDIGGAYRLDNASHRWIPLTDGFGAKDWNLYGIESIGLDPTDPNRVYLAVGQYMNNWCGNGAILRSNDQGRTWLRTDLPFHNGGNWGGRGMGERLCVDPLHPNVVFFGSRANGLWRSSNYGANWTRVSTFPQFIHGDEGTKDLGIPFLLFGPDHALYAGAADRAVNLVKSTDGGSSWSAVPGQPAGLLPWHGAFDASGNLYLTYGNTGGPNGVSSGAVWKWNSGTGLWTDITPLKGGNGFGYAGLGVDTERSGTVMVATIDRWGQGDDIFRTTDGGASWTSVRQGSVNDDSASPFVGWAHPEKPAFGHWIGCVQIDPFNSNRALYVTGATLWGTDNLTALDNHGVVNWAIRAQGIEETAVNDLVSPPVGAHLHSALADIGGFRHDDLNVVSPTGMRHDPRFGSTDSINFAELKPEVMVCSGSGQPRASYTLDGGTTWMPVAAEPAGTKGPGPIALGADGLTMVWSPEGAEPSISTDFGANWTSVDGLRPGVSIVPDRANPSWFYALDSESGCLLVSTDGGHTFLPRTTGLKDSKGLRTVPGRVGDLWLVSAGQVLHSTDAGESFTGLNTVDTAETLGFGKAAPGQDYPAIYLSGTIGGVQGVFRSDDTGRTWVRINDDEHQYGSIGHVVIGDPRVYGRVYVATNGRGILYADPAGPSVASASTPPSQSKPAQPADVALAR